MPIIGLRPIIFCLALVTLTACSTREVQDSLAGATAQQLLTHSIDDLVRALPADDFSPYAGRRVHVVSHFPEYTGVKQYADERLGVELTRRYDIDVVDDADKADIELQVFYTALGTDQDQKGFYIPIGFMPGVDESTQVNLVTLQQFHGVAEMYYFIGPTGTERRGAILQSRTRTDALGLPIITIPISSIDRAGEGAD
ncbi:MULTISPECIES: hypothetical protein [unclassified Wenzhouxiangella]|uniref:hypothetical protein n=1 Tax=unclassified Wenzhouxiangella TaxID=2613841 RepID=UPI000E329C39|nr:MULTISPECIES: hypothetical protein [unclassified Wenzhouxiangella]RFF28516.1 hypothetical protein DZK25_02995 [Wenzhouxiangella sp. 15181]RFP70034.1 hypothetical protein DZK26_02095 [Wenzhouxiangella sp. 15190]